jgi:hypothetical protein
MNILSHAARAAGLLAWLALMSGCASAPSTAPPTAQDESLLVAAGFKTAVASTDQQLKNLPALPPGQVTVVTQTGTNWFIYPDLPRNRVYVGTQKQYQAYLKLRAQNNLPAADPLASYYKQDAAMNAATARDASIPAWEYWPGFNSLGWD